jgi:hypothetical protein
VEKICDGGIWQRGGNKKRVRDGTRRRQRRIVDGGGDGGETESAAAILRDQVLEPQRIVRRACGLWTRGRGRLFPGIGMLFVTCFDL